MSRKNLRKGRNQKIQKAEVKPDPTYFGELGSLALTSIRAHINALEPIDLRYPHNIVTYERMLKDDAVSTCVNLINTEAEQYLRDVRVTVNKKTTKAAKAVKFVDHMLKNMEKPLSEYASDFMTSLIVGFAVLEIVHRQEKDLSLIHI